MFEKLLSDANWGGVAVGALIVIVTIKEVLPVILKSITAVKGRKNADSQTRAVGDHPTAGQRSVTNVSYPVDHRKILERVDDLIGMHAVHEKRTLEMLNAILGHTRDLHSWHDVRDGDGLFRWMNRASTEMRITAIETALTSIECPKEKVATMARKIDEIYQDLRDRQKGS